jgi:flagellar hook-associated protein FlgK
MPPIVGRAASKPFKFRRGGPMTRRVAMNSLSSIAQSGIAAALLRLDASANNIANAATPGYRRQLVVQESPPGGGVTARPERGVTNGENLAEDLVRQRLAAYAFKANLRVIQTQHEMLGSLLDVQA